MQMSARINEVPNHVNQVLDRDVRVGHDQVDVPAEVPQHCYYRLTETSPCENGGERWDQILVRMTHRHFAVFRTRVKPYRAYNSSGPVCR